MRCPVCQSERIESGIDFDGPFLLEDWLRCPDCGYAYYYAHGRVAAQVGEGGLYFDSDDLPAQAAFLQDVYAAQIARKSPIDK